MPRTEVDVKSIQKKKPKYNKYGDRYGKRFIAPEASRATILSEWGTKIITPELLFAVAEEISKNANGETIVDICKKTCKGHSHLKSGERAECIYIFTIKPCGCITRTDQHIELGVDGELKRLWNENIMPVRGRLPVCKKHK